MNIAQQLFRQQIVEAANELQQVKNKYESHNNDWADSKAHNNFEDLVNESRDYCEAIDLKQIVEKGGKVLISQEWWDSASKMIFILVEGKDKDYFIVGNSD